jgi:hypothetical protein
MAAVRRVDEISRGQSVVTHWISADVGGAPWEERCNSSSQNQRSTSIRNQSVIASW